MFVVYTGLSIVGPHVFAAFGLDGSTAGIADSDALVGSAQEALESQELPVPAWVPLAILMILTGGATHFRSLNQVEFFTRRLTRSEEHTSELQSLMRISSAVFCLTKKKHTRSKQTNKSHI